MIDPRAFSEVKLKAPAPLPLVSRRALKRCSDAMQPPTACPYCAGPVALESNSLIYGREYGDWPYTYICQPCDAYVGLHPFTDLPLGTLATRELRNLRKDSKAAFFALPNINPNARNHAYEWLALRMGMPYEACHFGMFTIDDCKRVLKIVVDQRNAQ